jgi:hypothetical protein
MGGCGVAKKASGRKSDAPAMTSCRGRKEQDAQTQGAAGGQPSPGESLAC